MAQTTTCIRAHLFADLAQIVDDYLCLKEPTWHELGFSGHWERALWREKSYVGGEYMLHGACEGGYILIVKFLIEQWHIPAEGMQYACRGNHRDIIDFLITRKDHDWNNGLTGACEGGHIELAKEMITRGATAVTSGSVAAIGNGNRAMIDYMLTHKNIGYNSVLWKACQCGNREIVYIALHHGATNYDSGLRGACEGGHLDIATQMLSLGASDYNGGLCEACTNGHVKLVDLMISIGATSCSCKQPIPAHIAAASLKFECPTSIYASSDQPPCLDVVCPTTRRPRHQQTHRGRRHLRLTTDERQLP